MREVYGILIMAGVATAPARADEPGTTAEATCDVAGSWSEAPTTCAVEPSENERLYSGPVTYDLSTGACYASASYRIVDSCTEAVGRVPTYTPDLEWVESAWAGTGQSCVDEALCFSAPLRNACGAPLSPADAWAAGCPTPLERRDGVDAFVRGLQTLAELGLETERTVTDCTWSKTETSEIPTAHCSAPAPAEDDAPADDDDASASTTVQLANHIGWFQTFGVYKLPAAFAERPKPERLSHIDAAVCGLDAAGNLVARPIDKALTPGGSRQLHAVANFTTQCARAAALLSSADLPSRGTCALCARLEFYSPPFETAFADAKTRIASAVAAIPDDSVETAGQRSADALDDALDDVLREASEAWAASLVLRERNGTKTVRVDEVLRTVARESNFPLSSGPWADAWNAWLMAKRIEAARAKFDAAPAVVENAADDNEPAESWAASIAGGAMNDELARREAMTAAANNACMSMDRIRFRPDANGDGPSRRRVVVSAAEMPTSRLTCDLVHASGESRRLEWDPALRSSLVQSVVLPPTDGLGDGPWALHCFADEAMVPVDYGKTSVPIDVAWKAQCARKAAGGDDGTAWTLDFSYPDIHLFPGIDGSNTSQTDDLSAAVSKIWRTTGKTNDPTNLLSDRLPNFPFIRVNRCEPGDPHCPRLTVELLPLESLDASVATLDAGGKEGGAQRSFANPVPDIVADTLAILADIAIRRARAAAQELLVGKLTALLCDDVDVDDARVVADKANTAPVAAPLPMQGHAKRNLKVDFDLEITAAGFAGSLDDVVQHAPRLAYTCTNCGTAQAAASCVPEDRNVVCAWSDDPAACAPPDATGLPLPPPIDSTSQDLAICATGPKIALQRRDPWVVLDGLDRLVEAELDTPLARVTWTATVTTQGDVPLPKTMNTSGTVQVACSTTSCDVDLARMIAKILLDTDIGDLGQKGTLSTDVPTAAGDPLEVTTTLVLQRVAPPTQTKAAEEARETEESTGQDLANHLNLVGDKIDAVKSALEEMGEAPDALKRAVGDLDEASDEVEPMLAKHKVATASPQAPTPTVTLLQRTKAKVEIGGVPLSFPATCEVVRDRPLAELLADTEGILDGLVRDSVSIAMTFASEALKQGPFSQPPLRDAWDLVDSFVEGTRDLVVDMVVEQRAPTARDAQRVVIAVRDGLRLRREETKRAEGTPADKASCALELGLGVLAQCLDAGTCDLRQVHAKLASPGDYFNGGVCQGAHGADAGLSQPQRQLLLRIVDQWYLAFSAAADVEDRQRAKAALTGTFDAFDLAIQLAGDETGPEDAKVLASVRRMLDRFELVTTGAIDKRGGVVAAQTVGIFKDALEIHLQSNGCPMSGPALTDVGKEQQQCLKGVRATVQALDRLLPWITTLTAHAEELKELGDETDAATLEAKREARTKAVESLITQSTRRKMRDGDWVASLGANVGVGSGFSYDISDGSGLVAQSARSQRLLAFPDSPGFAGNVSLDLPMGVAIQRLPDRYWGKRCLPRQIADTVRKGEKPCQRHPFGGGFHAQISVVDLGQFLDLNDLESTPAWNEFLMVGAQLGLMVGSPQNAFTIATDVRYQPYIGQQGSVAVGFVATYYVPFFDLN